MRMNHPLSSFTFTAIFCSSSLHCSFLFCCIFFILFYSLFQFHHLKCLLTHSPFISDYIRSIYRSNYSCLLAECFHFPEHSSSYYLLFFPPLILPASTPSWNLQCNSGATCGQFFFAHVIDVAAPGCRMWVLTSNVTTSDTCSCEFLVNIYAVKPTSTEKHLKPFYWGRVVSVTW